MRPPGRLFNSICSCLGNDLAQACNLRHLIIGTGPSTSPREGSQRMQRSYCDVTVTCHAAQCIQAVACSFS